MADTSQHELSEPHTNGAVDGLTEEEKSKMRPADIDADMREMERRKRVEMMMNSRLFREELERIIETQMKDGGAGPSGLLQQISDMMGAQGARFNSNVFKSSNCVVPINDIRGVESMGYAKGEKLLRCKLAAVFRLLDLYGWTQGVGGHITARLNQDQEHFLVNPYGLLYHEVTASSLVKVDMQGSVVEQGTTNFGVHITAFQLHSTIHASRPDIKCIIHITTPSVIAVSSLKCGLLPLGQESIVIGEASVHQYIGGVFEPEEKEKISRNLGPVNKIMFLTNRGALCCGETVEEAFYNVYNTVLACETQLKLMPVGIDNLTLVSEESRKAIFDASRKPPVPQHASVAEPSPLADKLEKRWRIGGTEFEALMRMLDNAGFRTGYIYRNPLIKGEPPRPRNDVEVPPAVSSLGYLLEEEELYKQGLWKGGRKGTDRSRWLNSPNVYQKVEILETGTPDPKKITKWVDQNAEEWVTDGSPTHSSTPVKIESALQFVPKNTNPKEFKQLQQQIKDYRRADKISAGPQSHILEGVTWDEAKKMQDATISATGEQVVLVGAASKGIIQRGFQHNAMVYKTPYAKNPFDAITDQELDQYKKDVERKQKGDPYDESQSESEGLSSFNVSRATHESSTAKSPIQSPISVTSETEEESRDEPRVLRIETKQVPVPSQPEVVLSDETTADAIVVDTPIVEQAIIQQTKQQMQNIIHQKAPADATTEFLNEMRRTAIVDPRNDLNRRDCQSSNSSSVISAHSYGCCCRSESYDTIHLEVARSRTLAPRMTPMITEIIKNSTKNNELIYRTNINIKTKKSSPPPVPPKPKPKPYVALRNAFLNNLCHPLSAADTVAPTNSIDLNANSNNIVINQNEICNVNYKIDKIQIEQVSEILDISNEQITPIDLSKSARNEEFEKNTSSNGKIWSKDTVSVSTDILEPSTSSKGADNDRETVFRRTVNVSHKPVIVGAILKNINDLHTLCLGTDVKLDSLTRRDDVGLTKNDNGEKNLTGRSDENGNLCTILNKSFNSNEEIIEINDDIIENNSNNERNSNYEQSEDTNDEIVAEKSEDNNSVNNNNPETEFCEQEMNNESGNCSDNEFRTPPRARNYIRLDSLAEVINSVKVNLTPTKMLLSVLPESNISSKYNLDSTNMSLIYSLTPTNDDTDVDKRIDKNKSNDLSDRSYNSEKFQRLDSCNTDESVHDEESDFIWVDLLAGNKKHNDDNQRSDETTIDLFDTSMESLDDNISNQGSDILELPYSTVRELRETDQESFNHDMKTMANQIIAELGDIEIYTNASNFVDEILYDISCLKFDQNCTKDTVSSVVQDKLNALGIAKDIANNLISDLPCFGDNEALEVFEGGTDYSDGVIVIEEIVHHVIDKFESHVDSSPDSYNLKKVKESTNIELKEMQNNSKPLASEEITNLETIYIDEESSDDTLEDHQTNSTGATDPIEVIAVVDIDEELNLIPQIDQRTDSKAEEIEIDASGSSQNLESSVDESSSYKKQKEFAESSPNRFYNNDERFFITLESFSPSNHSRNLISDFSNTPSDSNNDENHSNGEFCNSSPLDCDECSFIRFKKYHPTDDDDDQDSESDCKRSYIDFTTTKSSLENTESDITDHDTLGEAILEFCTIAKIAPNSESMDLNFSIERINKESEETGEDKNVSLDSESKNSAKEEESTESIECICCSGMTPLEFISLGHLPPISEEINESWDNYSCEKAKEENLNESKTSLPSRKRIDNEFDYLDFLSDSEILIAEWFEDYITATNPGDEEIQKSPNRSAVSLESVNTVDYFSCKDDSRSTTAFQSLQDTTESSPKVEKDEDSDVEVIYIKNKDDNKLDRTYTLSDTSINSLDTVSSIESDEHKLSGKLINVTYSADISTNIDEANYEPQNKSHDQISSSSSPSSETRLSIENENCFDTTANFADISGNLLIRKFERAQITSKSGNKGRDEQKAESSLPTSNTNKNETQNNCMVYSYDTKEFMRLEEALAEGGEGCDNDDNLHSCEDICNRKDILDDNISSPIDPPPRYEDTTLYRVVSEINLNDHIIFATNSDVDEFSLTSQMIQN